MVKFSRKKAPLRRRFRRRAYKKKVMRRRANVRFNGSIVANPFGLRKKAYHRYVEMTLDLNPGAAGTPASYVFSANGLYDPNITGTGHQPVGFDQLSAIFDRYTVIASKIKVSAVNFEGTYENMLALYISDDSTPSVSGIQQMVEDGACKYTTLTPTTGSKTYTTITHKAAIKRLGNIKNIMDDPNYSGYSSTNPPNQWYWIITAQPNHTADTANVRIFVQIDYVAIWSQPKRLAGS